MIKVLENIKNLVFRPYKIACELKLQLSALMFDINSIKHEVDTIKNDIQEMKDSKDETECKINDDVEKIKNLLIVNDKKMDVIINLKKYINTYKDEDKTKK